MYTTKEKLFQLIDSKKEKMVAIRRQLHENPELSFEEKETANFIAEFYQDKECLIRRDKVGNGIVVTIETGKPGKHLAIRADFDALPIQEETGLSFSSKNPGIMHACGHDAHTAYMLILAESLIEIKQELTGKISILHQPAEETPPGGAIQMIKEGCLDGVDHVLGSHVMAGMPVGQVFYREGAIQTGRASFKIKIQGKGGHGSMPHTAIDSIVVASEFVTNVQTIVSRRINPFDMATITIGSFDGKGSANVIKDSVVLEGDVRMINESNREKIKTEFERVLKGVCVAYGASYELTYIDDYPVLVNDEKITQFVAQSINNSKIPEVTEVSRCDIMAPSEDFAYYAQKKPSCFFYIGATGEGDPIYPHHHPKFFINEDCLPVAAKTMGACVVEYLSE